MSSTGKSYRAHPNGKRPPFDFDMEADDGTITHFVCQGSAQMLDLMAFATAGSLSVTDPRGAKAIMQIFEVTMGPLVFEDFKSYLRANDVDPEVTLAVLQDMVEYTLNRPLGLRSPSTDGRPNIGLTSMDGSTVPVSPEQVAAWQATALQAKADQLRAEAADRTGQGGPARPQEVVRLTDLAKGYSPVPQPFPWQQGGSQTP